MLKNTSSRICHQMNLLVTYFYRVAGFAGKYEKSIFWFFAVFYKFSLDALYIWAASPQYSYAGLVYAPSSIKYAVSTVMYFTLFAALPKREKDTVSFLVHLQFLFTVAPLLSFYALSGGSSRYILMVFLSILLQIWIVRREKRTKVAPSIIGIQSYVTVAMGIVVIYVVLVPLLYNGFAGWKAFDFNYIYTMRANASFPPGYGYLQGWVTGVILPFGFLCCIHKKRYPLAGAIFVLQILLYMELGHKFILFILFPILVVYFFGKTGHLLKLLYGGFILLCIGVIFAFQLDKQQQGTTIGVMANALIAIRAIFHPADNKFNFYECFSQFPKMHFSEGILGNMFSLTYPYAGSPGQVIHAYSGGEFLSANMNTGYLGDSYAQMGFLGMLLMSALLGYVLRGLSAYDNQHRHALFSGIFAVYIIILNDGALLTTLFSGGMMVAFLLVSIYFGSNTKGAENGIQRL